MVRHLYCKVVNSNLLLIKVLSTYLRLFRTYYYISTMYKNMKDWGGGGYSYIIVLGETKCFAFIKSNLHLALPKRKICLVLGRTEHYHYNNKSTSQMH